MAAMFHVEHCEHNLVRLTSVRLTNLSYVPRGTSRRDGDVGPEMWGLGSRSWNRVFRRSVPRGTLSAESSRANAVGRRVVSIYFIITTLARPIATLSLFVVHRNL
jgi:hypothetical protein